ncbi:hypothetical protein KC315_g4003 [Hortaea werneckii]|nr:hypothetical protein KC315_g4003 [Hortaea werneckii]KAI7360928.1 hypothetical protein KC354_g8477 [Hortaea werneckii]
MSAQLWTGNNQLVERLRASWDSGTQLVLERSDEASATNLNALAELYWVKLCHIATLKMAIGAVTKNLTEACQHLDDLNLRLSVALTTILDSPHRFMSWAEANAVTPEWLDLLKLMTPDHPKATREKILRQLQARAMLDATRPIVPLRSRYNDFAHQLCSVARFATNIPELLLNSDASRGAILTSFSRLTVLNEAILKLNSLKNQENHLQMLSRRAQESFDDLSSRVYDEAIIGLGKPIELAEKEVPQIEHLSRSDLVSTAQRLLDKALSKDDLHMLNEASFAEAMMAYKIVSTHEVVVEA